MHGEILKKKKVNYAILVMYLLYFLCCLMLFYRQSIQWHGKYYSDLKLHIEFGLTGKDNYSIVYVLYRVLYNISNNTVLIAVFLAAVTTLTVIIVYYALKYFMSIHNVVISNDVLHVYSFVASFAMSICIPQIYQYSYYGTLSGQAWHNSTYLLMRMLGIGIVILYFKIEKNYLCTDFSIYSSKGAYKFRQLHCSGIYRKHHSRHNSHFGGRSRSGIGS